jgi:glycosyltransferase involved in cell wall biosynthesis
MMMKLNSKPEVYKYVREKKTNKIVMVDSLIGNDYTFCLGLGLAENNSDLEFIVPENREFRQKVPFKVKRWAPAKDDSYGKLTKIYKYSFYLVKLFFYSLRHKDYVFHFQFFRRRTDAVLFYLMGLAGVKLVYTAHNILPHERSFIDRSIQSMVYKSARAIIVHSLYIKSKLLRNFKVSEEKVFIIPHGNFDIYLPSVRMTKNEARKILGLSGEDKVVLFFGYIREYKGVDLLLDAFAIAAKHDPQLKLVIAGMPYNEALKERYEQQIRGLAAGERLLTKFGFVPSANVQDYFESCDLVVLPYKNIDHSGIIHLAYSFCKPVVVSAVGDFPETVEHGKSGFVMKDYTPAALSDIILAAVKDKEKLKSMGEYARHLNDTKYSWTDIGIKTAEVYGRL